MQQLFHSMNKKSFARKKASCIDNAVNSTKQLHYTVKTTTFSKYKEESYITHHILQYNAPAMQSIRVLSLVRKKCF